MAAAARIAVGVGRVKPSQKPKPPLPVRDGVSPSCAALPEHGPWATVAEHLIERFTALSADAWLQRIAAGDVVDDRGAAITASTPYAPRSRIHYYRWLQAEPELPFEEHVLHQDDHLVVVDKPHFMPVTPGGRYLQQTLLVRLRRRLGLDTLVPLHRLDRETAGVMLLSVNPATRGAYQALFRDHTIVKRYEAIVPLRAGLDFPFTRRSHIGMDDHFLRRREEPGAANAETRFELLDNDGRLAHLRLLPVTGRTHQLRVHCAALGMPIVNDLMYPVLMPQHSDDVARPLQLLAQSIAFLDPLTSAMRAFDSRQQLRLDSEAVRPLVPRPTSPPARR